MARTSFLEGGGEESLFVYDHSLENSFKDIYNQFKQKKALFRKTRGRLCNQSKS